MKLLKKLAIKAMNYRVITWMTTTLSIVWRVIRWPGREIFSFLALLVNARVWLVSAIVATSVTLGLLHLAVVHGPNVIALSVAAFSEGKGESEVGRKAIIGSIFERVARADFPTTPADVVYQARSGGTGCQYDGPCDRVPDNLDSKLGRKIFLEAMQHYVAWQTGVFRSPVPGCHSYATKAGYENAPAYFGQFSDQRELGSHIFFCGDAVKMSDSPLAVKTSPRPKPRPTDPTAEAIVTAVRLAQE